MGTAIISVLAESDSLRLGAAWERSELADLGQSHPLAPECPVAGEPGSNIDVAIDFTAPDATAALADHCATHGIALVVGTTGLEDAHHLALNEAAKHIALVQAANMSVGINVLVSLVEQAARMLGPDFDLELVESHHKRKKDAPSGTAMRLLDALMAAREGALPVFERHGIIGERPQNVIGVQTIRGGDVVGEHTVYYLGDGERVELTHRATDRAIFARGALRAAQWVTRRPAGRYTMADVLGSA
jgi:4-hydroxy-tetrahydrodipicolinate reductase